MFAKLLDGLAAIRGFGDQSHICLGPDQNRNALPDDGVIVNHQNPN
jgi:hypothetical protein